MLTRTKAFALSLLLVAVTQLLAEEMPNGPAKVTTMAGQVSLVDANGQDAAIKLHSVFLPTGHQIETAKKSTFFMALSNGTALGIGAETEVNVTTYQQAPFSQDKESLEFEPSVSKIQIHLTQGRIALSTEGCSPLSEFNIHSPIGRVRLHSGNYLIEYDTLGLRVAAFEGNGTYYYPSGEKEFISKTKSLRISNESAALSKFAEIFAAADLSTEDQSFAEATKNAANRVFFKAARESGGVAEPVLIVKPEYFDQDPMRPYEFKD